MGTCQLCLRDRKLIKAHIVPQAFYASRRNEPGPAKILTNTTGIRPKKSQQGIYDPEILCEGCDGDLGRLDQHAAEAILQVRGDPIWADDRSAVVARRYPAAQPRLILLFAASVLWRAWITQQDFFGRVALGPYGAVLRALLLNGEDGDTDRVDVQLAEFDNPDCPFLDPHSLKMDGVRYWLVYANRFMFYIKLDRRKTPPILSTLSLRSRSDVVSVVRRFDSSKERSVMKNIALANPNAFAPSKG
jgi:hypothetical protein